jgi:hypothetical protein
MFIKLFLILSTMIVLAGLATLGLFVTSGHRLPAFGIGQGIALPNPTAYNRQAEGAFGHLAPEAGGGLSSTSRV